MFKLIVGVGNPGPQYFATRHNAGFWFIDDLAKEYDAKWKQEATFHGALTTVSVAGQTLCLLKPNTFMNRSGQSVVSVASFYKILPSQILVVHDELDLAPGTVKLKTGGGHAGHNGLKSISAHLGTPDYFRLRIGIGHPRDLAPQHEVVDFVLSQPRKEEQEAIDIAIERVLSNVPLLLEGQLRQD